MSFHLPIVSVYMTVRNGMPYVQSAIASIKGQTLSQWELIVFDDGSEDETYDYILGLCREDNRIKLFKSGAVGRARSLIMAVEKCSADLIANLDADDLMHPLRLEIQAEYFNRSKSLALNSTGAKIINREIEFNDVIKEDALLSEITPNVLVKKNIVCHTTVMMRRSAYFAIGGYDQNRISQIDYDLWLRMIAQGFEMNCLNNNLGAKRIHSNQSFENKKRIKYLLSCLDLQLKAIENLGMPKIYIIFPYFQFIYGTLPQSLRMMLRKMGSSI